MTNNEKLVACYTDMLDTLYDMTGMLAEDTTVEKIEQDLATIEKISVILKRLGETQIVQHIEENVEDEKIIEEEVVL